MKISQAIDYAKLNTERTFDLIEKRGNKSKISGLKISTLKEIFKKGYCVKTVEELQNIGLIKKTSTCTGRKIIFAISVNSIYDKVQLMPIR